MMQSLFEKALGIEEPWYVKSLQFDPDAKRLDIAIDFHKGAVFTYVDSESGAEYAGLKAYDTTSKQWRHLNFFEHECYLNARVPRVKLPEGKVRTLTTPWEGLSKGFTLLFEALLIQLASSMPVHSVSKLVGVHDDKLWDMLGRYIEQTRAEEDFSTIEAIGMDETSQRKGHDYITLFVDMQQRRTIYVTEGKSSQTLHDFTADFEAHQGKVEHIEQVSCDMSPAFIKGVKETLPHAQITFDKFHILKLINEAVDDVRKEEYKTQPLLKGTKYLWMKNRERLTDKQQETLQALSLSRLNLKTFRALRIREAFQALYEAPTHEAFESLLKRWYFWATHSRLEPIKKVARTIKNHWDGILSWFESRINNGILEGLNSLIQAAKAKARGYRTFKNYSIMVYLLTGKLDFSRVNTHIR